MLLYSWKKAGEKDRLILSSDTKYNQINFSKNHVSGNARKIGVTFIWWFTMDCQDSQLLQELTSITQAMDRFKVLGHDLAIRIQDCKERMFIGSFREINDLHEELLPYRALLEKIPLEEKSRFTTHFRRADFLYAIASKMVELVAVPDNEFENHVNREFPAISEENFKTVEMMVRLRKMELSINEIRSYPDAESREDYKLKIDEIGRYLAGIRPIVGRKVTSSYRRKLGLV